MIKTFDFEVIPVVNVVNEILLDAKRRRASDVHFDPRPDGIVVRIRVDGVLYDYATVPNKFKQTVVTRIKIVSGMNITESRLPQDGAIKTTLEGVDLDLRVASLPTSEGEKVAIRILDYSMSVKGIESLGFTKSNYDKVLTMLKKPDGIILVTGATGVGKSTTVYSILQRLNTPQKNIVTVEDPIEMDIAGINQVKVQPNIDLTFANVLRSVLRQDPNIIMIGEIRDTITAKIAVRASITGHLVLSTIHTNNSLSTIERLLDMDVERYLLATALSGIISQKLARKLCKNCTKKRPTSQYEKNLFKKVIGLDIAEVSTAVGCEKCGGGFLGRLSIHEVLLINREMTDKISNGVKKEELRKLVYENGDVKTLLQDGLIKVASHLTTFEEVLKLIELEDGNSESQLTEALKTPAKTTLPRPVVQTGLKTPSLSVASTT